MMQIVGGWSARERNLCVLPAFAHLIDAGVAARLRALAASRDPDAPRTQAHYARGCLANMEAALAMKAPAAAAERSPAPAAAARAAVANDGELAARLTAHHSPEPGPSEVSVR